MRPVCCLPPIPAWERVRSPSTVTGQGGRQLRAALPAQARGSRRSSSSPSATRTRTPTARRAVPRRRLRPAARLAAAGGPCASAAAPSAPDRLCTAAALAAASTARHPPAFERVLSPRAADALAARAAARPDHDHGTSDMLEEREEPLAEGLQFEGGDRPHRFQNKPVFFCSSRVHPGGCPSRTSSMGCSRSCCASTTRAPRSCASASSSSWCRCSTPTACTAATTAPTRRASTSTACTPTEPRAPPHHLRRAAGGEAAPRARRADAVQRAKRRLGGGTPRHYALLLRGRLLPGCCPPGRRCWAIRLERPRGCLRPAAQRRFRRRARRVHRPARPRHQARLLPVRQRATTFEQQVENVMYARLCAANSRWSTSPAPSSA